MQEKPVLGAGGNGEGSGQRLRSGRSHHPLGRLPEGATRLRSGARGQVLRRAPCDAGCCASTAETALETAARARSRRVSQGHELHLDQLYTVRDGGTIALDWLLASDCEEHLMVLGMELFIMMIQQALLSCYLD